MFPVARVLVQIQLKLIQAPMTEHGGIGHRSDCFKLIFLEVYASMDVDDYVQSMVDASATAVLFNTGGITASYQTKLPFQYKNPHMDPMILLVN